MATNGGRIEFQVGLNVETKSIQNLKTTLQNLQKIRPVDFSGSREELKEVQKTATQVEEALRKAFNVNLGSLNIGKFNTELQQIDGGLDGVYRQFSKLGGQGQTAFSEIAKTALTSNFQLKETNSLIQQMGTTLVNTIKWNIASSAINGFTQEIQSAFTYVKSLDAALTDIRIVTGDSQQKMQQFAVSANKAAQSLGRSTMDYTKSALTFYQQGLSDEDVQARTEAVLKAQNITGTGSEMADYMTAVWNGYKVANEEAELYVDKLAAVADSSASDMSQLAIAMSRVASTANNMGVDIDQLNAQIATVVATTRQAPESVGTAFKTIYTRLNDIKTGADEAEISLGNYSGKMASIGFNVLDTNGRLRDTGQIMEEIGERWQTLTKEQQIYLASTMGGQRQVNQLMALFNNWTTYSDLLNVSLESEGTLAEKNSRYMESLGAKMNQFAAAQERVKTAMIDTDSWKSALEILTSITNLFGSFVESIGGGGNAILAFGSIFMQVFSGPISQQLNSIITNLKTIQQNSERKEADIAMTQLFGKSAGYENQAVQQMVAAKREIQQYYSFISAEEANAYNEIVKQVGATSQQVDKVKSLKAEVESFQDGIKKAGETLGISFETALENAGDVIEKLQGQIKDVSITDFVSNASSGENFYKNLYGQLSAAIGENAAVPALKELKTLLEEDVLDFGKLQRAARNALNQSSGLLKQDLDIIQKEVKQASADFELADGQKKRFLENVDSQAFTRAILDVVSATGQLAAGFNSLKNVVTNVWGNENLSAGEKILQTITSLSFAIPSLVGAYNKLKIAVSSTTLSEEASTMASIVNYRQKVAQLALIRKVNFQETLRAKAAKGVTATQAEQAMMTDLSTAADMRKAQADAAVAAQAELTAASVTTLNLALGAVAGIAIVFTVLQKYKQHIDAVKQAAEDFKEKTKGIAQNSENNKNTIQELKDLEQEYNRLSEKAGNYDTNISKLTDSEKARWDEIKNKIASANPDIVGAYNAQGQAILNNNNALQETINLLNEKNKKQLETYVNSDEFKDARKGRAELYKEQKRQVDDLESRSSSAGRFTGETLLSWQSLTNKEKAVGVSKEQSQDIRRLDELRQKSLQELAQNREQYDQQFKELLNSLEDSNNSDVKRLVAANKQKFLEAWTARLDVAGDLAAQIQAAKSKLDAVDDANPQAILMELMWGKQDSAEYQALTAKDLGVQNAESYILAWLEGHKEGRVNQEPELKKQAKDFEDQLLKLFTDNKNLETTLNSLNEEYKKQTFNTAQERVEWIADAINRAMKNLTIDKNTQDAFITVLNTALGLNLNQSSFDFASKDGKFIKSISDPIISAADKARAEIQAKTGDEIGLGEILGFSNTGDVNWELIASQIAKCDLNSENWRDVLIDIISKQHEIAQNQSLITSLSSITQTGEKLQSGKSVSAKDQAAYHQNLNAIIDQENTKGSNANQQLIADAELLKQTWLAGSEEYEQALARVQRALIDTATAQAELEGRAFTDEELENLQKYATTTERVQDLYNRGVIKDYTHYQALLNKAIRQGLKDMKKSPQALKEYAKQLQKNTKITKSFISQSGKFNENVELNNQQLELLAYNALKTSESLKKVQKVFKNSKISSKDDIANEDGSIKMDMIQPVSQIVTYLNEVPGLDINENQIIKYFDNVKQVINGTKGAFQELQQKLFSDQIEQAKLNIPVDAKMDPDTATKLLDQVNGYIQSLSPQDIQAHAYLHDETFVNNLKALVDASVITAEQANAILGSIGGKLTYKTKVIPIMEYDEYQAPDASGVQWGIGKRNTVNATVLDDFKVQPLRPGGTEGIEDLGGGSGGKGGGGGGGSKGKELSKKDQKKEDLDPYHDINRQLERINKQYSLLEKNEEKLVGTDLIDNLTDQNKLLDKNIGLLRQKHDIGEEERKQKAEKIAPLGVEFDERGEITNYNEIRQKLLDEYNALIKEWNELAEAGTALPEEERKKKEEDLKEAQKKYEENKKNIDDYLEHLDTQAEVQLQLKEKEEQKIQNEIKKFKIKIDLHIDYSEALRDWRDFEDKVIDQLRDDDIFGNIESRFKNIFTYFDEDDIGKSLVGDLTDQVNGTLDQIEKMKNGVSQIYGNNMAQAMQDLDKYTKQLMSSLTSVKDLMEEIKQSFFDLVNKAQESFDEQTDEYEALASWIEHDRRLMELLYGDEAYEKFQKFDQKQAEVNLKQLDFYQKQKDFWWEQMEVQKARMDQLDKQSNAYKEAEERFKELEKHWLDTAKTLNSTIEDSIDNLIVKYENTINKIFGDLDKKLTDDKGLDPLAEEWELINKEADQYLDDVNALFEIEKLGDAYKDALKANEGNAKVQNSLNKMMNEQLGMLKDKDKLTQYDVDRANKLLEIELKRIALEEARQNKTRLRLKRDSQGNYSYQFTADEEETDSRRQELAAARNELYNMDKQQYKNNLDEIIALTQQAMDRIKQLYLEGKDDQAQALAARYNNIIGNLTDQNGDIKNNLQDSAFDELSDLYDKNKQEFLDMSDAEKDQLMNGLVPQWDSGVQAMTDKFAGNGGFLPTCQDAFVQLADATKEYKDDLQDLQDAAQINFDEITAGINDTAEKTETLLEDNQDLIEVYEDEFETMEGVIDQLKGLAETYEEVRNAAIQAAQAALKLKQAAAMDPQSYSNKDNNENSEALEDGILVVKKDAPQYQGIRTKIAAVRQDDENYYYRDPSKGSSSSSGSSSAGPGASSNSNSSTVYIPKKKVRRIVRGSTGMYTGSWGDEGKLAILHEKELVLKKDDTANILAAVSLMRHINSTLNPALSNFNIPSLSSTSSNTTSVDQQVHIQASFPNVQDRNEIEQAFNNLINRASQYAFNTDR